MTRRHAGVQGGEVGRVGDRGKPVPGHTGAGIGPGKCEDSAGGSGEAEASRAPF